MSTLVCNGPVVTGLLQTNGRKVVLGSVPAASLVALSGAAVTSFVGTTITFTAAQSLPAGYQFVLANQPGVVYTLASPMVASATGTTTVANAGATGATTASNMADAALSGTPGNVGITFTSSQSLPVGYQFQLNGTGTVYPIVGAAFSGTAWTQTNYSPTTAPDTGNVTVTPAVSTPIPYTGDVLTLGGAAGGTDSSVIAVQRVAQLNGEAVQVSATPWATLLATPGAKVLTCPGGTFECVGADRQPVTFVAIPASSLVP